jgi:hypothetical protein
VSYELIRPDHLASESWDAIESYRKRLAAAAAGDDRPAVLAGLNPRLRSGVSWSLPAAQDTRVA